jgi:hypothetical protein
MHFTCRRAQIQLSLTMEHTIGIGFACTSVVGVGKKKNPRGSKTDAVFMCVQIRSRARRVWLRYVTVQCVIIFVCHQTVTFHMCAHALEKIRARQAKNKFKN